MTSEQYIGLAFTIGIVVVFAWIGVALIMNPKQWLERNRRSTADNHIRAVRLIGGGFLAFVLLTLWHFIRQFWR